MVHTVCGVKRSVGSYEGYDFDNVNLHCNCTDDGKMVAGTPVDVVKFKAVTFNQTLKRLGLKDAFDLVGCQIRVFYDRYGKAEDFDILDMPNS